MSLFNGWFGEKITSFKLALMLDGDTYKRLDNVIVPSKNGTSQIDHILVSPYGIFIIETKDMAGWIFGSESQDNWVQCLFGKKYRFQNPIKQTFRQKKVLSEYLEIDETLIHTIIYFVNSSCDLKTKLPTNVVNSRLDYHIKLYHNILLSHDEISCILTKLKLLNLDPSLTKRNHLKSLKERHNSTTICPKCGGKLVERTAKRGPNIGSKFFGCENYPKCKFIK